MSLPDSYIANMPSDPDLLPELGRVAWAAARLHAGVRDAINRLRGGASDRPFSATLGQALGELKHLAAKDDRRPDIVAWVDWAMDYAVRPRNKVIHTVTYTAEDGKQAIISLESGAQQRLRVPELRSVTAALIEASMKLPA